MRVTLKVTIKIARVMFKFSWRLYQELACSFGDLKSIYE